MQTIETIEELRDWLVSHKIPEAVAANGYALDAWERALDDPSKGKIYSYWCMAGLDMHFKIQINWASIQPSIL